MENKKLIDNAIGFIQNNPKENLSLQSIAENAGFSLNYFDAIFKRYTGYTPIEYSRIYKLTRSALELRNTKKTVLDIALDYGYTSPEGFARAFKSFYSLTPSEYREKYSGEAVTWHDLSGKIATAEFKRVFSELKVSDVEIALDWCFTHNPLKYAEDIVGMTVAETEVFTLGDPELLEHFVYVSDYDTFEPLVTIICESENKAVEYVSLLAKLDKVRFNIRRAVDDVWDEFDAEIARLGLICRYGFDMIYSGNEVDVPEYDGMVARMLTVDDMAALDAFKKGGGCAECHTQAIRMRFEGKGNIGMAPMGVFEDGKLVCLAMPTLDEIRELKKYDIGAMFIINATDEAKTAELMWKYAIDFCLKEYATIGNARAAEDKNDPLGVESCERIGLVKVAKSCIYSK